MQNKTNILIMTGIYPPEIGGPATYTYLMKKELSLKGFVVSVLPFSTVKNFPKIIRHILYFFKILYLGRKIDIFYAQDPVSVGIPTFFAAKILNKHFIIRVAGDYAWEQSVQRFSVTDSIDDFQTKTYGLKVEWLRKIQIFCVRHADCVITPSKYFRDLVSGWIRNKEKVIHIYNGVDLKDINLLESFIESKTIISAGRLLSWKGFDTLIRILVKLPDWKLYIAGDGSELENLLKLSTSLGVSDRVTFLGSIPRQNLLKKIQQCEIFILNTTFESFSFQVVEAMHVGTPVITTRVGSLAEIIDDNTEGILVEPNNEDMIISAVQKIHNNESFRNEIIKNALKKSATFSLESTVEKTSDIIKKIIQK